MASQNMEPGVFELVTELCHRTATKHCAQSKLSQRRLVSKMRSHAYEIILKKSPIEIQHTKREPILDLLSYYLTTHRNIKNVAEYKRSVELKKIISTIRKTNFGNEKEHIYNVLKFLLALTDSITPDFSPELFEVCTTMSCFLHLTLKPIGSMQEDIAALIK